jgi:hypothetical protein
MGHDDPRLRWHWLHGLSSEINASVDARLFYDHRIENMLRIERPPWRSFYRYFISWRYLGRGDWRNGRLTKETFALVSSAAWAHHPLAPEAR